MQEPEGAYPMQQQVRKPVTTEANSTRLMPPTASKLATSTHTALLQMVGGWPLDRSLPPQEPEEDNVKGAVARRWRCQSGLWTLGRFSAPVHFVPSPSGRAQPHARTAERIL